MARNVGGIIKEILVSQCETTPCSRAAQRRDNSQVAEDLATSVLTTGLVVVQNTRRRREDNDTKRTGREQLLDPLLDTAQRHVEAGRDDAALVDAAHELHNNCGRGRTKSQNASAAQALRRLVPAWDRSLTLAAAVVVDDLVLADVAC